MGGGLGTQSAIIAQTTRHVKCIVQDREKVIPDTAKVSLFVPLCILMASGSFYARSTLTTMLLIFSSRVKSLSKVSLFSPISTILFDNMYVQGHDFFTPQPIKNARVYFMRMILHDWSDSACIQILKHIRDAASPDTELIVIDSLLEYACNDTSIDDDIPGMASKIAPEPLLPNYGHANLLPYVGDMQVRLHILSTSSSADPQNAYRCLHVLMERRELRLNSM